jgi:hypothetical protein
MVLAVVTDSHQKGHVTFGPKYTPGNGAFFRPSNRNYLEILKSVRTIFLSK